MIRSLLTAGLMTLGTSTLAFDIDAMTPQEQSAFGQAVRTYLLDNPQVLMEAIAVLEQQQQQAQATSDLDLVAANRTALTTSSDDWVGGNLEGDLTIVEFMDYRCGYCRRAAPEVEQLVKEDGNIRLIVKEFPILGDASRVSAEFAVAVKLIYGDEAYKQVHDALIDMRGEPTEPTLNNLAQDLGFDSAPVFAAMPTDDVQKILTANAALAQAMQISGTPTFVFGEQLLRGYVPLDAMRQLAEQERL